MATISLRSADGEIIPVDIEVAKKSVLIKTLLEDLADAGEDAWEEVPLPNINAAILKLVIQWATHHKDDPKPNDDENTAENINITDWDDSFLRDLDQDTLYELILAANYLDIKGLWTFTCWTVANMIRGRVGSKSAICLAHFLLQEEW